MRLSAAVLAAALAISATMNNIGGVEAKRVRKVRMNKNKKRRGESGIAKATADEAMARSLLKGAAAEEDSAYWDRYLQADMMSLPPTKPPTNPPPTNAPPTNPPPTNPPPTNPPPTNPPPTNPPPTDSTSSFSFIRRTRRKRQVRKRNDSDAV